MELLRFYKCIKKENPKKTAIALDFDGVLAPNYLIIRGIYKVVRDIEVIYEWGKKARSRDAKKMNIDIEDCPRVSYFYLMKGFFKYASEDQISKVDAYLQSKDGKKYEIFKDLYSIVKTLIKRRFEIYLITGAKEEHIKDYLTKYRLYENIIILSKGDTGKSKRELLKEITKLNKKIIFITDSPKDMWEAINADTSISLVGVAKEWNGDTDYLRMLEHFQPSFIIY